MQAILILTLSLTLTLSELVPFQTKLSKCIRVIWLHGISQLSALPLLPFPVSCQLSLSSVTRRSIHAGDPDY